MSIVEQAPSYVRAISPYVPGKPITELARQMGIPVEKIVKLASNENPLAGVGAQGGFHLPVDGLGWLGLGALTFLYGTAFTIMFVVLPRLGVVGNSAIMNIEPIFALVLAWALLGQTIAAIQVAGGLVVVGTVVWLGLRRS